MKKTLLTTLLLCAIFAIQSFAQDEEGFWPRSYFAGAGFAAVATRGDVNTYIITTKTDKGEKEIVHNPELNFLVWPDFFLGVDIGQFSLSANFNYWYFTDNLIGFGDVEVEARTRIWRFGIEFIYNFFWPEFFQPGFGVGYSYTSIKSDDNVFPVDDTKQRTDAELMGSSIAFIANLRYFLTDFFVLQPSLKFYETWFGHINTENGGTADLKHKQWQTFVVMEIALVYHF